MVKWRKTVLVLAITFILAVSVRSEFIYFLFGFEIMLCIAAVVQVRLQSGRIRMKIVLDRQTAVCGETFQVRARLTNDGVLPVTRLYARIAIRPFPDNEELLMTGKVMLCQGETGDICFELDSSHIQSLDIRADKLEITDYLGIAKRKCRVDTDDIYTMYILPAPTADVPGIPESDGAFVSDDGDNARDGGTDVDISEIRQYKSGDAMKLVHWKLSARLDDIMVRTLTDPADRYVWLYLDLEERYTADGTSKYVRDTFVRTVSGISVALLESGKKHEVCWIDIHAGKIAEYAVYDENTYQNMLMALLRAYTYSTHEHTKLLEEFYSDETKEKCIKIDLQGNIGRSDRT